MGTLYLVRHGQASFGADNYDQLSPLGERQCERLGEYLRARGQRFEAVITGTLQRHLQSHDALARGLGQQHEALRLPDLNEYDSHAVLATVHEGPLGKPTTPEAYKHHFRLLRQGLAGWMAGALQPEGMPTYADFAAGVQAALDHVRSQHRGDVLIVSSGGPISTAVGLVLGTPAETGIDLNMQLRNSAICEFSFNPKRHVLVAYNALPHLDSPEHRDWVTYT
ncbi:histidine phosphatase family protein [Ideonella sp. DXS22W]|uniref:Histidine phosphatase family protein n=1 Tax=Pseudaquabacterium inlustre TaxID=2984192 RepID=A0ABU9CKS5_9BURK